MGDAAEVEFRWEVCNVLNRMNSIGELRLRKISQSEFRPNLRLLVF
jgi:hypothetical protein